MTPGRPEASGPEFGPYRLVEALSSSATASVHRAVDRRHDDRIVALKVFAPALSADPAFRARFHRDAAALSALREPHVVSVHTYGEHDGTLYLDMRFVDGQSLAKLGGMPVHRAAAVTSQIAEALDGIETGGLGRRSVGPSEVLVTGGPGHEFVQLVGLGLGRPPARTPPADPVVAVIRPRGRRRPVALVALVALVTVGVLVGVVLLGVPARERPQPPPGALAVLDGSAGVSDVATAQAGGRPLVAGVLPDGTLRTWDAATGDIAGPDLDGSTRFVGTAVVDGAPVAVTRDEDQVVHVRELPGGRAVAAVGDPEPVDSSGLLPRTRAVVPAELGGRPVVVLAEPADAGRFPRTAYRVRAIVDGTTIGPPVAVPGASLSERPATTVLDGRPVIVTTSDLGGEGAGTGDEQRVLRVFDMASGVPVGSPTRVPAAVTALRVAGRAGAPVAVLGCSDNRVRVVDLRTGTVAEPAMAGHVGPVRGLLVVDVGTRTLVGSATSGPLSEIRFWDLATGAPVGPVLRDHPAAGGLLAAGRVGGRAVLVATTEATAAASSALTVWDVAALLGEANR